MVKHRKVHEITLRNPITFNGNTIEKAFVDIDHVNHGIDKKTKELNKTKRTNFSLKNIEKFIMMLDGEYLFHKSFKGRVSRFEIRIDCPINAALRTKSSS